MSAPQPRECEVCYGALNSRQRRFDSPHCRALAARAAWLLKVYGLTLADYDRMLKYQNFRCAICKRPPKPDRNLSVDHAHEEGQRGLVRGLLCFFCNKRILGARTTEILVATAAYVTNPPAVHALGREVTAPGRPKKPRAKRKRR